MQQALQLQTQGKGGDQETYHDDKHEIAGHQVLPTEFRAGAHWSLSNAVRPPRRRQMLVVWRDCGPAAEAPLPPLQQMERPAEDTVENSGTDNRLESGRCRHIQISELFTIEEGNQAEMDFLATTEVGKSPRK